jgi:predicted Zn finger-like uncharacterized protein
MAIQIQCPGCKAVLQVDESLAGKQGRCIHCGHRLTVPASGGASVLPGSPSLSDASPEAMVRELYQRGSSALLVVFEPSADGSYDLADVPELSLRCIVTEDINQERFTQLLDGIGKRFGGKKKSGITAAVSPEDQPYELKGDRLGMSLEEFKKRYARSVEGSPQRLPLCSDEAWGANRATLHVQPWHRSAGIVHARVDLPAENDSPTIAGVKTELVLYHFVDGRLYRISAFLPTDLFHQVNESLVAKYGPPAHETKEPRQLVWENRVSSIVLSRGTVHPPEASTLHFIHKELAQAADSRVPKAAEDI